MASKFGIELCERERIDSPLTRGTYLNEPGLEDLVADVKSQNPLQFATVGASSDWLRIPADKSILIRDSKGHLFFPFFSLENELNNYLHR